MKFVVFSLLYVLSSRLSCVDALKCYECSSNNNPNCTDPFSAEDTLLECPPAPEHIRNRVNDTDAVYCRKIKQIIDGKHRITTRMCGYLDNDDASRDKSKSCFKDAFSAYSSSIYCDCKEEGCNRAGGSTKVSLVLALIALGVSTFSIFRQ